MKDSSLAERLIYLDVDFVSRLFESEFNISPETQITRTQGLQASASLPLFSGGGSTSESKAYKVSTLGMLDQLTRRLGKYPPFEDAGFAMNLPSGIFWVEGVFTTSKVRLSRKTHTITLRGKSSFDAPDKADEVVGEEAYFTIKSGDEVFALSPTDEYFVPGISSFKGLSHLVIDSLSLPCTALLRVFSASTSFGEWVATPLVIYDPAR
jgi:hypothetical protein